MASRPLIELSELDLTQRCANRDEILAVLSQRGTFAMLDGIVMRDEEAGLVVGYKEIRREDWWAPDHIPGRPIFPGVLQIEAGAQLCSYDYLLRMRGADQRFIGFGGLNETRFRGVVEPDVRMHFVGKVNRIRSSMFTYFVQGFVEQRLVFETEVIGVAL